ncbi:MAG TPA: helix-turn-helix transcriptional regulator, partial [Clostridiaceae bacterium]|nr:helix-turn-helix transcriptional regulator [Clostridiaceae bacterium]
MKIGEMPIFKYLNLKCLSKVKSIKIGRLLVIWLISYLSMLLIPILISGIVYVKAAKIVENEINNNNLILLKQVQTLIDKKMSDVKQLGLQVAWNSKLVSLFYNEKPMNSAGRYSISRLQKDLRIYKVANGYIHEIYVYLHNSEMFVSSSTSYNMDLLQTALAKDAEISADQFRKLSKQELKHEFTPLKIRQNGNKEKDVIAYILSLPYDIYDSAVATLVILLNYSTFLDEVSRIEELQQGTVLIFGENNQIIAITGKNNASLVLDYNEFSDGMLLYKNINGQQYIMSSISSTQNKWKYIFMMPSFIFMEKVKYIKTLMMYSILMCLFIGGIVAYIFTKKNYDPIYKMVQALAGRVGIELNPGLNEYSFVQQAINNTLNEKEIIMEKLEKQNLALRSSFLARLIKGKYDQTVPIEEALSSYDIQWISDLFCVMLFYIEYLNKNKLFQKASLKGSGSMEQVKLLHFIFSNVIEELVGKNHYGLVTEVDDMIVCLVNINGNHVEQIEDELVEIVSKAQKFIKENFYVHFTASIGRIHKTLTGIPESYREAQEAMEYRMVMGSEKIIRYNQIQNPSKNFYDYPLELEQQLINAIKIGDLETAQAIVNEIFEKNFSGEILSVQMIKCLFFDLISTMIKALNDINLMNNNEFIEELNPISRLLSSNTIMEMKSQMMDILEKVCKYVESTSKDRNKKLSEQIVYIIENNYMDDNLSITSIAGKFGLTAPYISKIFKDTMGEGIQDYINKVRLNKAKALLLGENENLECIA